MKKVVRLLVPMLATFLIFSSSTTTHAFSLFGGSWSNPGSLKYWLDSSVTSYGYNNSADRGLTNWNPVSSRVNISRTYTASNAQIKVYAGDINKTGVYADALNYRKNLLGQSVACWDCNYASARIRINDPVARNYDSNRIRAVMIHETGHVLGINHSSASTAIMYFLIRDSNEYRTHDDNMALQMIYGS